MIQFIKDWLELIRQYRTGEIPRTLDDERICKPIWKDYIPFEGKDKLFKV